MLAPLNSWKPVIMGARSKGELEPQSSIIPTITIKSPRIAPNGILTFEKKAHLSTAPWFGDQFHQLQTDQL